MTLLHQPFCQICDQTSIIDRHLLSTPHANYGSPDLKKLGMIEIKMMKVNRTIKLLNHKFDLVKLLNKNYVIARGNWDIYQNV